MKTKIKQFLIKLEQWCNKHCAWFFTNGNKL